MDDKADGQARDDSDAGATPAGTTLGSHFVAAVALAVELHKDQRRKGSTIPYVAHLLGVCSLVLEHGGNEDEAVAALLHDAVEDQGGRPTLELIRDRFGDEVAAIVEACSDTVEDPKPPALQRKRTYVAHLDRDRKAESTLLVSAADKLHNLRSMLADYHAIGDRLWARFNLDAPGQLWYYRALADVYRRRLGGPLAEELRRLIPELAEAVVPARELRWARLGLFADCAVAAVGDPNAIDAPPLSQPSQRGWLQRHDAGGVGMLLGAAETDGLPVEIGLAGSHAVAARVEFVHDVEALARTGEGHWYVIGRVHCERLVAAERNGTSGTRVPIDLPLPPGDYTAEVFETRGDAVGLRLRLA